MSTETVATPTSANLQATPILDHHDATIRDLAVRLRAREPEDRKLLQSAHRYLVDSVKPVYTLDELQPASQTLRKRSGSCSQRMARLVAVPRAFGVPEITSASGQRTVLVPTIPHSSGIYTKQDIAGLAAVLRRGDLGRLR